ncbi:MAG TPA: tRNA (N6-threonylcarbamoyladenosine(37)-N6)-methyltransferase TrmO [Methanocorpusculum sp.]|nr:tRNA (N6-threonylcarbamoyladenosine(37)-N6)-methyltransferase TrmO [Methanocorpusculum sp.]
MKLTIYTDGAARGNPGKAAAAWLILENTDVLEADSRALGVCTNNTAEYSALISALKAAKKYCAPRETELEVVSDSELMIKQMRSEYTVRADALKPLYAEAQTLAESYAKVTYRNVPRENPYISSCDWMCNQTLDLEQNEITPRESEPEIICRPIGYVSSPFKTLKESPNWGRETAETSIISIKPEYKDALEGLHAGDNIFVLCWFHLSDRSILKVHPRGDKTRKPRGVFSTRSPVRPNPISLTLAALEKISGTELTVSGLEAVDGTPVLDIKPYYSDSDRP